MNARLEVAGREIAVDLARPFDLSIELDFQGPQVRHFGAPLASSQPFSVPGFTGSVARGASCNCESITLVPHCNGTHTECAGHLTREAMHAHRIVPRRVVPALLLSRGSLEATGLTERRSAGTKLRGTMRWACMASRVRCPAHSV